MENFHFNDRIQSIDLEDFAIERYQKHYRDINLVLGFSGKLTDHLYWGLVARNLIDKTYLTAQGHQQKFKPQFRAGLSLQTDQLKVSADIDLSRNDPLGYDPDKKFFALGVEHKLGRIAALRMGYRHNLIDHTQLISLGAGIDMKYGQVDFAVAGHGDEVGVSLQASLSF